ncbi:hypothetical protein [Microbacterium sp. K27]|uniref:hypothetical protein n=1 Tax=Microbacterium sp. K27 TaxID=2305445 RepID=UPI00109BA879|nr:hypothetical protein [Microbacterium sp. K27]
MALPRLDPTRLPRRGFRALIDRGSVTLLLRARILVDDREFHKLRYQQDDKERQYADEFHIKWIRRNERYNGDDRKDHQNTFEVCDHELSQHQRNLFLIARIAMGSVTGNRLERCA